jgi:hypothetical protein
VNASRFRLLGHPLLLLVSGASPQPPLRQQVIHLPGHALLIVPVETLLLGPLGGLPAERVVPIPRHNTLPIEPRILEIPERATGQPLDRSNLSSSTPLTSSYQEQTPSS